MSKLYIVAEGEENGSWFVIGIQKSSEEYCSIKKVTENGVIFEIALDANSANNIADKIKIFYNNVDNNDIP